jgi:hypothetical protein
MIDVPLISSLGISVFSCAFFIYSVISYIINDRRKRQRAIHSHEVDHELYTVAEETLTMAKRAHYIAEEQRYRVELLRLEVEVVTRGGLQQ